jgi:molybdopterin synthase catalytic subunit
MICLTDSPIDVNAVIRQARSPAAGAVVLFLGTAREATAGRPTESLDYEAYGEMAEKKLAQLEQVARQRWQLVETVIAHRTGHIEIGDVCVAIAVSAAHRAAAFEAGRWLIDTLKEDVPIWKCENWADGSSEWVHPGIEEEGPHGRA